jgi:hypothetical protein
MRYDISFNTASRIILTLLGAGPGRSWVEVDDGTIRARLGWSGSVTIPRQGITSVERVDGIPWWLGYGMHGGIRGTWAINGSDSGAIKLTLNEPASGRVVGLPVRARTVYFSLEDPEAFIAAVRPTAG